MPVLDWTRTDLEYVLPDSSSSRFDQVNSLVQNRHLKRPGAEADYRERIARAAERSPLGDEDKARRTHNIIAGLRARKRNPRPVP